MQKLTLITNPQRSSPEKIRRLSSISNSNGDVFMKEFINLPTIPTKSTIEQTGIQVIKPNKISIIGEIDQYNQQHPQENNNLPSYTFICQGQEGLNNPYGNFLEKYYQNKSITKRKTTEASNVIRLQQENRGGKRRSSLQIKTFQSLDKSNDSSRYSYERTYQIGQRQIKTIKHEYSPEQYFNPDLNLMSPQYKKGEIEMLSYQIEILRRKLKITFLFVFSSMIISKKYRLLKKEDTYQIFKLNNKLESCQQILNKNGVKFIEELQQQFVYAISKKVIHFLKCQQYINECNTTIQLSNTIQSIDLMKIRIQNFSKLIYQNLELLTREKHLPELIKCQLITSLYKTSKQQTSYFVGERCHFYQQNIIHISREQKLAIAMEYLLFQIIIPNLLKLTNNLQKKQEYQIATSTCNQKYKIQSQKILVIISSLLHQQFINKFQNLQKVKDPNGYMVNKRLTIQYLENEVFLNEIKTTNNTGDNNQVLEGLLEQEQIQYLENSKPIWKSQIDKLFEKILQNIESLINF